MISISLRKPKGLGLKKELRESGINLLSDYGSAKSFKLWTCELICKPASSSN